MKTKIENLKKSIVSALGAHLIVVDDSVDSHDQLVFVVYEDVPAEWYGKITSCLRDAELHRKIDVHHIRPNGFVIYVLTGFRSAAV